MLRAKGGKPGRTRSSAETTEPKQVNPLANAKLPSVAKSNTGSNNSVVTLDKIGKAEPAVRKLWGDAKKSRHK